jgi:hypothetical protein
MPARKAGKKSAAKKSAAKKSAGATTKLNIIKAILRRREWVMYAQPIKDVIATGNIAQMRIAAELARTHLADVQKSVEQLDARIRAGGR